MRKALLFLLLFWAAACKNKDKKQEPVLSYPPLEEQRAALASRPLVVPVRRLDSLQIIHDLQYLASDTCAGRKPGTPGHRKAMERILQRMRQAGLDSFPSSLVQSFKGRVIEGSDTGSNIVGWLKGSTQPDKYIILTAHYDHLGTTDDSITYYGADDNASGVACLLALAHYFSQHPPAYSLVFATPDREETGLEGAFQLAGQLVQVLGKQHIIANLNMDMIARSDKNELFACGIRHYPSLARFISEVQTKTNTHLLMGHDGGGDGDDWTSQSDHEAFHRQQIPFIYTGVEDHADYHKPTDTFDKVNYSRYIENCNLLLLLVDALQD